jgi:hypothetical protein
MIMRVPFTVAICPLMNRNPLASTEAVKGE